VKTRLTHYTLRGGPKNGSVIYGITRYRDLLIPTTNGGTLWYEHRTEANVTTGGRRDVLVYIGTSLDGKRPTPEANR
jgi:hypothetical protein